MEEDVHLTFSLSTTGILEFVLKQTLFNSQAKWTLFKAKTQKNKNMELRDQIFLSKLAVKVLSNIFYFISL